MGPWPLSLDSLVRDMNAGFGFQLICIHRDLPLLDFLHFSSCCGKNVEQMSLRGGFLFTFFQPTSSLFQNLTIISVWSFMMNIGFTFYCLREEISIWNSNLYLSYDEEWGRFALLMKGKKKEAAMAGLWLFLLLASLRHVSFHFFWKASAAQS